MIKEVTLLPNGLEVVFYPETHQYFVNDREVPSITSLLKKVYGDTYAGVNPAILKASAEYGSRVHDELNKLISMRKENNNIPLVSDLQEVNNYFTYIEDIYKIHPEMNEKVVALYDENNNVVACGRFDMLCYVGGKLTLVDFKTTSSIHKKLVTAQLNLYLRAAYQSKYITSTDLGLGVVQLSGITAKYVPIPKLNDEFCQQFYK